VNANWFISLWPGASVVFEDGQTVIRYGENQQFALKQSPSAFQPLFESLLSPGISYSELCERSFSTGVPNPVARLAYYLQYLARWGFITLTVKAEEETPLARLDPISREFKWPGSDLPEAPLVLSRFAYLRREFDCLVLESPLALSRVVMFDVRLANLLSHLSSPHSPEELIAQLPGLSRQAVEAVLSLLYATGVLTKVNDNGESEESKQPELQAWEFHDLQFHSRSRPGRHDAPLGATYRFIGQSEPPPAVKPMESDNTIKLTVPDLQASRDQEPAFLDLMESRRSIREFGDPPINETQLSEFLYRTARIRAQYQMPVETPTGPLEMDFVSRPYPSGGALYELEVYPLVQRCDGLHAGLYRYDAVNHQLVSLSDWSPQLQQLVDGAGLSTGIASETIQVVILLASRFSRLAWKYASIAYALTLKHVGVLYQTMYLTATAMGLAPCGMGSGNSDIFAKAIGSDYFAESTVGEFLLGSVR